MLLRVSFMSTIRFKDNFRELLLPKYVITRSLELLGLAPAKKMNVALPGKLLELDLLTAEVEKHFRNISRQITTELTLREIVQ